MDDAKARWQRVEAALDELLNLDEAARRIALGRIAATDSDLHAELESLLVQMQGEDALLDHSPLSNADHGAAASGGLAAGTRIGIYRIVDLIGRGGMGEVYRAERADGQYEQRVALKLIRRDLIDQVSRFQTERQLLARLDHPGIARLLDGGIADDGRPYMVMELTAGQSIVDWCRQRQSALDERLRLFLAVCDAVAYAHRNLVVHRDIKPGNVLVTQDGAVKLLDFGIARMLGAGDETQTRSAPLTPGYAAPEQLTQDAVTTATDVYALGLLLFELLTGDRPWHFGTMPLVAAMHKVLTEAPPAPSRFVEALPHPAVPSRLLKGDLDAIVAKALRKEPDSRYPDARALAEDIQRHLDHRPIQARDGARWYVLQRTLRRHWLPLASAGMVFAALATGIVATLWEARIASEHARTAESVENLLLQIFRQNSYVYAGRAQARHATAEQLLDTGAQQMLTGLKDQPAVRGKLINVLSSIYLDDLAEYPPVIKLESAWLDDVRRAGLPPSTDEATSRLRLGKALCLNADDRAEQELRNALTVLDQLGDNTSELRAETLLALSDCLLNFRPVTDTEPQRDAGAALEVVEAHHPDSILRLSALEQLADVAYQHEDDAAVEQYLRRLDAQARGLKGPEADYWQYESARKLGNLLRTQRHFVEAEQWLSRALQFARKIDPDHRLLTCTAEEALSRVLFFLNQPQQAEDMMKSALKGAEASQGEDDVRDVAVMRYELAMMQMNRGDLASAQAVLERNLEMARIHLGGVEKLQAWSLVKYASLLTTRGELQQAQSFAYLARNRYEKLGETAYDGYGVTQATMAEITRQQGHPDAAAEADRAVMTRWPPTPQLVSDQYVAAATGLVRDLLDGGHTTEAVSTAQALVSRLEASPGHEYLGNLESQALTSLGRALIKAGKADDAEAALRRALEMRIRIDVPDSLWLAEIRVLLADSLVDLHRSAEAHPLLLQASDALSRQGALEPTYRREYQDAQSKLAADARKVPSSKSTLS